MLFLATWRFRTSEEIQQRSLNYFQSWQPPEGVEFKGFFGYVDGTGGCAIIETNDAAALMRTIAPFSAWMDFETRPLLPIEQSSAISGEALAARAAVLG